MSTSDVALLLEDDSDVLLRQLAFKKANIANPVDVVNDEEDCKQPSPDAGDSRASAPEFAHRPLNRAVEASDVRP